MRGARYSAANAARLVATLALAFTALMLALVFYSKERSHWKTSLGWLWLGGLIIMGTGFFFMSAASSQFESQGSSAMYWLVLAYLFHTIGELCASPVALSFITKLAPLKYSSIMMGTYFAMTGFGNKLAGLLGESASAYGEYAIFTGIAIFCAVFGLLILALLKKLKALTHGAEDNEGTSNEVAEGFEIAEEPLEVE